MKIPAEIPPFHLELVVSEVAFPREILALPRADPACVSERA